MKTGNYLLSDADLDDALDRLQAPPPSDVLRRRVETMAPAARHRPVWQRYAAAAALVLAIGAAAVLKATAPGEVAIAEAAEPAVAANPAGEIDAEFLPLVDGLAAPERPETMSVAGLPLE